MWLTMSLSDLLAHPECLRPYIFWRHTTIAFKNLFRLILALITVQAAVAYAVPAASAVRGAAVPGIPSPAPKFCREVSECPRNTAYAFIHCCRQPSSTRCSDGSPFNVLSDCVQAKSDFTC
ncbi:hypothetical protein WAI453_010607 [Rhynchosporium graminicola]